MGLNNLFVPLATKGLARWARIIGNKTCATAVAPKGEIFKALSFTEGEVKVFERSDDRVSNRLYVPKIISLLLVLR